MKCMTKKRNTSEFVNEDKIEEEPQLKKKKVI